MRKRIGVILLALMVLLSTTVVAAEQQATATEAGAAGITFSNGYVGFCIDQHKSGADKGAYYSDLGSVTADNNTTKEDVSQKLKILIVENFELIHKLENGTYVVRTGINDPNDPYVAESDVQYAIWNITDGKTVWADHQKLVNTVNSYTGPAIPDEGYKKTLSNGDTVTFYFTVMSPYDAGKKATHQDFFAYKIAVNAVDEEDTHKHDFSDDWKADDTQHWKECICGEKTDSSEHESEVRDRVEAEEYKDGYSGDRYCRECDRLLEKGRVLPATHKHDFSREWSTNEDQHWKECICGEKTDSSDHESEVRDRVEAEEYKDGYSGDTYCKECDKLLEKGDVIPQLHKCEFTEQRFDKDGHWNECECGEAEEPKEHKGGEATCSEKPECEVCGEEYGTTDPDNHKGETELRDQKDATTEEPGYTGDVYCLSCKKVIEPGTEIPQLHKCEFTEQKSDEKDHWKECECGEAEDPEEHKGGEATCSEKPECEVCGEEYGTTDPDNHKGETELRDQKKPTTDEPGYTGDVYCLSCEKIIEQGSEIPKLDKIEQDKDEPEKEEPTKEEPAGDKTVQKAPVDEAAETGDASHLMIWGALIMAACIGMTGSVLYRRKSN